MNKGYIMVLWYLGVIILIDLLNVLLFVVVDYYCNLLYNLGNGIFNFIKGIV